MKKTSSRQYKKQKEYIKEDKCRDCGKPLFTKHHCKKCAERVRKQAREAYRKKAGIPIDEPLSDRGRPKKE